MLPLGAALGWTLARRWPRPQESSTRGNSEYLTGLTHLVNQESDQAIASFLKAIEVDDQTIELHLTLGSLFRKRGEVDRALRIHENVLARPELKPEYRNQARFELAQDFQQAGVMDRAEALFRELAGQGMFLQSSLEHLIQLYEQSRDWKQAIETARQLQAVKSSSLRPLIAQYYCERADEARRDKDLSEALRLTGRALAEFSDCVRASLLQGAIQEERGDPVAATKSYRRIPEQDVRFVGEALAPLARTHEAAKDRAGYGKFLADAEEFWPHPQVTAERALFMQSKGQDPVSYLAEKVSAKPQWPGLNLLLEQLAPQSGPVAPMLEQLRKALDVFIKKRPRYQCQSCGFQPGLLFWQCPRCKQWSTIVPIDELS